MNMSKVKGTIAVSLVLAMLVSGFALLAPGPAKAANAYTWHFFDVTTWDDFRMRDSTVGGVSPNAGVARWYVVDTSTQYNTNVNNDLGNPLPGMSSWIGAAGRTTVDYYAVIDTAAAQTQPTTGEPCVLMLERDPNCAALDPDVYYSNGVEIGNGIVPHGYLWAATDNFGAASDTEVLASGDPPTTFFEVMELAEPTVVVGAPGSITWTGLTNAEPGDVAGDTESQITAFGVLESLDNNGPWTELGIADFAAGTGTAANFTIVSGRYYSAVPYFEAAAANIRSLVYSAPKLAGGGNTAPTVAVTQPTAAGISRTGGVAYAITWTASDVEGMPANPINISYSTAGPGGPWTSIATGETNDGTYTWTVASVDSTNCYVNVSAYDNGGMSTYDLSDNAFEIDSTRPVPTPNPVNTTAGVSTTVTYELNWNEAMNTGFQSASIAPAPPTPGAWAWNGNQMYRYTGATFAASTTYTVTLLANNFRDDSTSGNIVNRDYTFWFTTSDPVPPDTTIDSAVVNYQGTLPDDVTIIARGLDNATGASAISFIEYRVDWNDDADYLDAGEGWLNMTTLLGGGAGWAQYRTVIDLHNRTLNTPNVQTRAFDGSGDASPAQQTMTVADTTAPAVGILSPTAASGPNGTISVSIYGHDFRDVSVLPAYARLTAFTTVSAARGVGYYFYTNQSMTRTNWALGSNNNTFALSVSPWAGETISYIVYVNDGTSTTSQSGTYTVNAGTEPTNPLNVGGRVYLYNDNTAVVQNATVTIGCVNATGVWNSNTTLTDITGFYLFTMQPNNYTDATTILVNVTTPSATVTVWEGAAQYVFSAPGWMNYTSTQALDGNGTVWASAFLAIPYNITVRWIPDYTITPIIGINQLPSGTTFYISVVVTDMYGLLAPGYYGTIAASTNESNALATLWGAAVPGPINAVLDGLGGVASPVAEPLYAAWGTGTDGYWNQTAIFFTIGIWGIWCNDTTAPVGTLAPLLTGYTAYRETNMTHVRIAGGGFFWQPVAGWNIVSVPMNTIDQYGIDGMWASEARDAVVVAANSYGLWPLASAFISNRLPGSPASYQSWDIVTDGGTDFNMTIDGAYWLYVSVAIPYVHVNATELLLPADPLNGIVGGVNTVTTVAGWNMVNTGLNGDSTEFWTYAPIINISVGTYVRMGRASNNNTIMYTGGGTVAGTRIAWYDQPVTGANWPDRQTTEPGMYTTGVLLQCANTWNPAQQVYVKGIVYDDWVGQWNFVDAAYQNTGKPIYFLSGFWLYSAGGDITYTINT